MSSVRHKHVLLDRAKLNEAKRVLRAKTDTETIDRALDVVLIEAGLDAALRRAGGKARIRKVFR
jgi:hypothetical protein